MKVQLVLALLGLALLQTCLSEKTSYRGYKVLRVQIDNKDQLNLIDKWQMEDNLDVWNNIKGINEHVDIFLSPQEFVKFKVLLNENHFTFDVVQNDFQEVIEAEERELNKPRGARLSLTRYSNYPEIITYLNEVVRDNPDIASSYNAGTSYNNRILKVVVIKTPTSQKGIWLDCGIHAREWISPATCNWFIDRLIQDYRNNDPTITALLNKYEFHILPIVNPDGYEYTHTNTRLYRKNRAPNPGSTCIGVDLNRNFGYKWMVSGTSDNPCSDTFGGSAGNSELETKAVMKAITDKNNWEVFLTLHSYGQYWMYPFAYGTTPSQHNALLKAKSEIGAAALKAYNGTTYRIGTVPELLYSASGGSFDWAHAEEGAGIKHSYCLELRPNEPFTGFLLPERLIAVTAEESYVGMIAMIDSISKSPDN